MNKQDVILAPFYEPYLMLVPEYEVMAALEETAVQLQQSDMNLLEQLGDLVYAPGKWTIKDIFQHLIDCERIMAYRALRFARNDRSLLPAFDEDHYAIAAIAGKRSLQDIVDELISLRHSSIQLFQSFASETAGRTGLCMGKETSVAALGFIIAGHQRHHHAVITERYLPLIS